jgi:hypothetical protein
MSIIDVRRPVQTNRRYWVADAQEIPGGIIKGTVDGATYLWWKFGGWLVNGHAIDQQKMSVISNVEPDENTVQSSGSDA